jgi:hypothetical protein
VNDLVWAALWLYGSVGTQVLIFEALNWVEHLRFTRNERGRAEHPEWRPRWADGLAPALASTALSVILWPIWVTDQGLSLVEALRVKRITRRMEREGERS